MDTSPKNSTKAWIWKLSRLVSSKINFQLYLIKINSICFSILVMGGSDYTNKAPPNSYINVLDFETPKNLADYLIRLAKNETEYQQYFWWKVSSTFKIDPRISSYPTHCRVIITIALQGGRLIVPALFSKCYFSSFSLMILNLSEPLYSSK